MGYGSTVAVEEAEEEWREACTTRIKRGAAQRVGAGQMTRDDAIKAETELLRQEREADNDITGTLETMITPPVSGAPISKKQEWAIGEELHEAAAAAAQTL